MLVRLEVESPGSNSYAVVFARCLDRVRVRVGGPTLGLDLIMHVWVRVACKNRVHLLINEERTSPKTYLLTVRSVRSYHLP